MKLPTETALTFDDVLLEPAYSTVMPSEVSLKTQITQNISLNIPVISAAMDTVTNARLAVVMAQEGGLGFIHKNCTPEEQVNEVMQVKRYEAGLLRDPIIVSPDCSIRYVISLTHQHKVSGFPVIDSAGVLTGIITNRDVRFEENLDKKVFEVMTTKENLITIPEGSSLEEAKLLMHCHRLERVLVVNKSFKLVGLITVKDIIKASRHPNACKDSVGRLRVGAALGTASDYEERAQRLVDAGVDILVLDTAHAHSLRLIEVLSWVKKKYPDVPVIAGNIATKEAALVLAKHGADAVKVGIGPGSICTTRIITGVGVPQITAVSEVAHALAGTSVNIIADGGIRYSGDIAKAIVAGAHCVMVGGLLASSEEAPGEVMLYQGRSYKSYRGMGSVGAMHKGSADRYFQVSTQGSDKLVPEGIEGRVPYKGSASQIIYQMLGGLRAAMGYCGCANIAEMRVKPRFVRMTNAGIKESHVHDVQIVKESPNYSMD